MHYTLNKYLTASISCNNILHPTVYLYLLAHTRGFCRAKSTLQDLILPWYYFLKQECFHSLLKHLSDFSWCAVRGPFGIQHMYLFTIIVGQIYSSDKYALQIMQIVSCFSRNVIFFSGNGVSLPSCSLLLRPIKTIN